MPLYEYRCGSCSRIFESYTRLSDERKRVDCPACGSDSEKIGISLFGAVGKPEGTGRGNPTCRGGSRRSPFS